MSENVLKIRILFQSGFGGNVGTNFGANNDRTNAQQPINSDFKTQPPAVQPSYPLPDFDTQVCACVWSQLASNKYPVSIIFRL